ncbi:MAG: tetratricopeptide repeat protein [Hyphomicrobiaceae bacterium]
MQSKLSQLPPSRPCRALGVIAVVTASLLLGACASSPPVSGVLAANDTAEETIAKLPEDASPETAKAYWATAYAKNPKDEAAAIGFANALKATGEKDRAESVLQQAAMYMPDSRPIASELGRMALDKGNLELAQKLLARADDPSRPDWRVVSALGTIQAKLGHNREAQGYFERAHELAPTEPAVLNNLALTYALNGEPAKAEGLLRKAADAGGDTVKIRQNLALVLGVQGRFDEAKQVAAVDLEASKAQSNVSYLKKMVKATPVPLGKQPAPQAVAEATPAASTDVWAAETSTDDASKVAAATP